MLCRIALLLASVVATPVAACEDSGPTVALLDAIHGQNIGRIEALLDENQRLFEAGERTADDTRCLFTPFTRLRPETLDLVDDWLESHPASPYAHAAKAWGDRAMSWQIRGDGPAREVYPEALARFDALQDAAWEHAGIAYRARPRLIAASDALIMMANPQHAKGLRDEVLAAVMASDPNQGTLTRATAQILRGWGGSFEEGTALCDRYAAVVPGAGADAATRCKLPVARRFKEEWPWMLATLETGDFPDLDYLRMDFILGPEATRAEAEIAHRVMSGPGYEDLGQLSTYDDLALKYGLPLMTETVSRRRHDRALREIAESPYDTDLLRILSEPVLTSEKGGEGRLATRVLERPTPEALLDYARRRAQAAPYDAENWSELETRMAQAQKVTNIAQLEPYRVNAVVYGNHSAARLANYLTMKLFDYDAYTRVEAGTLPAEAADLFEGMDPAKDMICPAIRARRLLEAVCAAGADPGCTLDPGVEDAVATLEDKARRQGECLKERTRPAVELAFVPMPLPEGE